jgi:hypothetical protein
MPIWLPFSSVSYLQSSLYPLKKLPVILFFILGLLLAPSSHSQNSSAGIAFDFYGDSLYFAYEPAWFVDFREPLSGEAIRHFYDQMNRGQYAGMLNKLKQYKEQLKLDDWLFYQLIRKTAQQISPKADNYHRYTLYKWFFLTGTGYDATLNIAGDSILFYVCSHENIYNIPARIKEGKQYVCLNYHDYGNNIDFEKTQFREVPLVVPGAEKAFSYKVTSLPHFRPDNYLEKDIRFSYRMQSYYFKVKLNPEIKTLFANYPVVDYASQFNIPLSQETYRSLIPLLKKNLARKTQKRGVDYLMRFTRTAFLFETDTRVFGAEKRLTPEQTLLYDQSDCEDRAALFFYLVKEIYNLPMIVLSFPGHVTVAVQLDKPAGKPVLFNGKKFTVCEPTPQKKDLKIGHLLPALRKTPYEVVYVYEPGSP